MKSKAVILLFAFVSLYISFNREEWKISVFQMDVSGYYLFLPAVFIYHDLGGLRFYPEVNRKYHLTANIDNYGIFDQPTGLRTDKYAIGTSLFELPFFLIAHAYCTVTNTYEADGYSYPYQFAGIFCCVFWVCMGLAFIRRYLNNHFSDSVTAFAVLCIAFGTNIYYYTAFEPCMSHPFGFFLFAGILYYTDALYRQPARKYFYYLGLLLGLVFITRPVNIVVGVIPLLWQIYNKESFVARMKFFKENSGNIVVAFLIFFAVSLIQLGYWKYTSGDWLHYSYQGESFNFLRPRVWNGLFSYQKGWFVYTPMAFVAMAALIYFRIKEKKTAPSLILFFVLMIYVVFSWRQWWYGGSYGARALIESLPFLSLPLAFLGELFFYGLKKRVAVKIVFSAVILFVIVLNVFQAYQFSLGTLDGAHNTRAYYWKIFGKKYAAEGDNKYLMTDEEVKKQYEDIAK